MRKKVPGKIKNRARHNKNPIVCALSFQQKFLQKWVVRVLKLPWYRLEAVSRIRMLALRFINSSRRRRFVSRMSRFLCRICSLARKAAMAPKFHWSALQNRCIELIGLISVRNFIACVATQPIRRPARPKDLVITLSEMPFS